MNRSENWRPIAGYEGFYEVSDLGRVRSLDRQVSRGPGKGTRLARGRVFIPQPNGRGYLHVILSRDSKQNTQLVHRLVLLAFAGPPEPGQECRHGRGGQQDNRWPENLCWGTPSENVADRVRDGGYANGSANHHSRLTEVIVAAARQREAQGETSAALAEEFGVSTTTMHQAIRGKTWRHVPLLPDEIVGRRSHQGDFSQGSAHCNAKLTEVIVMVARERSWRGEATRALAREYGMSEAAMGKAVRGETWRHVPFDVSEGG